MTTTTICRDESFYIGESSMVIFLVEHTLFRVPRQALVSDTEDNFFTELFSDPRGGPGLAEEGHSDDSPICVPSVVTATNFRLLLHVLYPSLSKNPISLTPSNWVSILDLADMWQMTKLRDAAFDALKDGHKLLAPEQKITLGMKWNRRPWVKRGVGEIAAQSQSMTTAQIGAMGSLAASRLAQLREEISAECGDRADARVKTIRQGCDGFQTLVSEAAKDLTPDWKNLRRFRISSGTQNKFLIDDFSDS